MKNSAWTPLTEEDVTARFAAGDPYVIRVKIPRKEEYVCTIYDPRLGDGPFLTLDDTVL